MRNSNANSDSYTNGDSNSHADSNSNSYANSDANSNSNGYTYSDADTYPDLPAGCLHQPRADYHSRTVERRRPYPSNIAVAGLTAPITKVTVSINSLTHTFPDDLDFLLVGPAGKRDHHVRCRRLR